MDDDWKNIIYAVYILNIDDEKCKYGKTSNLKQRIINHKRLLKFKNIVRIYSCKNDYQTNCLEKIIKEYCRKYNYESTYNNHIEIFYIKFLDNIMSYINDIYENYKNDLYCTII